MNSVRVEFPLDTGLDLHSYLVKNPAATFFVRAIGAGMPALGILNNDVLVVDRSILPRNGSMVVAISDGELLVKHYQKNCADELWGVVTYAIHNVCTS